MFISAHPPIKNIINKKLIIFLVLLSFIYMKLYSTSFFDYPISTVFIDAGHGGVDSGAVSSFSFNPLIEEKDIVLDISLKVEEYLSKQMPELKIIQTRYDDSFPSLQERSELAYKTILDDKSSSLFVSIHANSSLSSSARGVEVFTKLENKIINLVDEETPIDNIDLFVNDNLITLNKKQYSTSLSLSDNILESIKKNIPHVVNRGIKSDDLYVLNVCRTTAALVEVGFISNEDEVKLLLDNVYRDKIAKAISDGIIKTINNRKR